MTISVIIPTYQHAGTIERCLEGIFAQSVSPKEIIVVNDGSTDGTEEILEAYKDRVTVVHQENQGGNIARNKGFELSTGDLVMFCDADLVMDPDMLKTLREALFTHPEASYAYSAFKFGWKSFQSYPFDGEKLKQLNFIHTSALIRREHFPGFDPAIRRFQDWDVWLTMLSENHIGTFIPKELFHTIEDKSRIGISQWRPSIMHHIPWKRLGWMPRSMRKYEAAKKIIKAKHGIV